VVLFKIDGKTNPSKALSILLDRILHWHQFDLLMGYYGLPHATHAEFLPNPNDNPPPWLIGLVVYISFFSFYFVSYFSFCEPLFFFTLKTPTSSLGGGAVDGIFSQVLILDPMPHIGSK
jgi:hypothetical protein